MNSEIDVIRKLKVYLKERSEYLMEQCRNSRENYTVSFSFQSESMTCDDILDKIKELEDA